VIWFSSKHSKRKLEYPPIVIADQPLTAVSQQRYLGIIFDCYLQWNALVSEVFCKCSYYLYLVGHSHKHLPVSLHKLLMESHVSLRIMYALPVWGPLLLSYQVGRLQRIQNRAVRVVFSLNKFDHMSIPHEQLGWPDVSDEIEICSLAVFHCHCFS